MNLFNVFTDTSLGVPHPSVPSPSLPRGGGVGTRSSCRRPLELPFILGMVYVCGKIMVGRVLLCTQTTASMIELTNKGATGPERAIETTISVGDNKGKSSELSPVDKLLLVE